MTVAQGALNGRYRDLASNAGGGPVKQDQNVREPSDLFPWLCGPGNFEPSPGPAADRVRLRRNSTASHS